MDAKTLQARLCEYFAGREVRARDNMDQAKTKEMVAYYEGCVQAYQDVYKIISTYHIK